MTSRTTFQICVISFSLLRTACGQGFINMNFEQALVPPTPPGGSGSFVDPALAFPGWTVSNAVVFYNDVSIGSPAASLIGPLYPNFTGISSLERSYSVLLQTFGPNYPLGAPALSQTALIPAGTRSITFLTTGAPGGARVTLNGSLVPLFALGSGLVGGDVTAYAGQQAQVTFSTTGGWLLFDAVRFSSVAVPEPSSFALGCIGIVTLVLARTRWSNHARACVKTPKTRF